jgi:hypothetical protein
MEAVFAAFTVFVVAAVPLAIGVTKAVDTLRNLLDKDDGAPKVVWNLVALVLGLGVCLGWQFNYLSALVDAIPALANETRLDGVAGQALTGITVGAMAGFWHEKMDQLSTTAKGVATPRS